MFARSLYVSGQLSSEGYALNVDSKMKFVWLLSSQEFYNASVPVSAQAAFPYIFAVSKFLQVFDLVSLLLSLDKLFLLLLL